MWLTRGFTSAQHSYWAPRSCSQAICRRVAPCALIRWSPCVTNKSSNGYGTKFCKVSSQNQWRVYGNAAAGHTSRLPGAKKIAGLYCYRRAHAGTRHWSEHGALLSGERSSAASSAVQESFQTGMGLGQVSPLRGRCRFAVRLRGLSRAEPILSTLRRQGGGRFAFESHW